MDADNDADEDDDGLADVVDDMGIGVEDAL